MKYRLFILLFIIIGTSLIMTFALVSDKKKTTQAIRKANEQPIGYEKWKAPAIGEIAKTEKG